MAPDFLTIGVSLAVGILSSYLTFRLQFERFHSMDREREKHLTEWRKQITADVELLKRSASITEIALLRQTLETLVKSVQALAKYTEDLKHLHIDPYEREVAKIAFRVEVLERKND